MTKKASLFKNEVGKLFNKVGKVLNERGKLLSVVGTFRNEVMIIGCKSSGCLN